MSYTAPIADIRFALRHAAVLSAGLEDDILVPVLEEAGRFAGEAIAPLNRAGDTEGAILEDGNVRTAAGWKEAYAQFVAGGWSGIAAPREYGGEGLPLTLATAVQEMWNSASMAFGICPVLTSGAIEALHVHAVPELRERYLPKLVSGEWTGTMNLTEPQAGSDLALLKARAEPRGDGTYSLHGTKIFITYGEHDLTGNIVHLVLARLPGAPEGHRGISLFLVPKVLPDGSRNDVKCAGLEHKMGLHGSPTCTMIYGEDEGAVGWLVGEENAGLSCMFTMMNNARLAVGIQGVAIAERSYQQALAYARERRQGRLAGMGANETVSIAAHPDVKRMLLTMRVMTGAARAICYQTACSIDLARTAGDAEARRRAQERANLITPVAKAFATDIGVEVASLGVQVHGGMGYIEETGAAQHLRDARIAPIYEGTNGIQAIDLVMRKIGQSGGDALRDYIGELRETVRAVSASNEPAFGRTAERLAEAVDALEAAGDWMLRAIPETGDAALAGATPYLRLFALAAGSCGLARGALSARGEADAARRIADARMFAETVVPEAAALEAVVTTGAEAVLSAELES